MMKITYAGFDKEPSAYAQYEDLVHFQSIRIPGIYTEFPLLKLVL
jgi:hypothetical protein